MTLFGFKKFTRQNVRFNQALAKARPLIVVHRGTGLGTIAENTNPAIVAAFGEGADMVEIDVVESTDGDFFLFHDGYEPLHFGVQANIRTMSTTEIGALNYRWCAGRTRYPVQTLHETLTEVPDALLTLDRSWFFWERLLPYLDQYDVVSRLLLKSPVDLGLLDQLAEHAVKYAFAPMVSSEEDIERVLKYGDRINTLGFELLPDSDQHPFASAEFVSGLQERGFFVMLNAINLEDEIPRFLGWDDYISVTKDPDSGWGKLITLGADMIQTDWPASLFRYRSRIRQKSVRLEPAGG